MTSLDLQCPALFHAFVPDLHICIEVEFGCKYTLGRASVPVTPVDWCLLLFCFLLCPSHLLLPHNHIVTRCVACDCRNSSSICSLIVHLYLCDRHYSPAALSNASILSLGACICPVVEVYRCFKLLTAPICIFMNTHLSLFFFLCRCLSNALWHCRYLPLLPFVALLLPHCLISAWSAASIFNTLCLFLTVYRPRVPGPLCPCHIYYQFDS